MKPEEFNLAISNSIAYVHAIIDEKVVGFGRIVGDKGTYVYMQDLIVDGSFQGQGIGTRLMRKLEHIVRGSGIGRGKLRLIASNSLGEGYPFSSWVQDTRLQGFFNFLLRGPCPTLTAIGNARRTP